MKILNKNNKQKGFSLIELMVVLGVMAFLVIAVLVLSKTIWGKSDENRAENAINQVETGIHSLYAANAGNYGTASLVDIAIQDDIAPSDLVRNEKTIATPWTTSKNNSEMTIVGNGEDFTVTLSAIPKEACTGLAGKYVKTALSVEVGGTEVTDFNAAVSACNTDENDLALTFR